MLKKFWLKTKKQLILKLVQSYIKQKKKYDRIWKPNEQWVTYSGPFFDHSEYVAAIDSLLEEWLILGNKAREFETVFAPYLGKTDGVLTNSGSSANLLMLAACKSKRLFNLPVGSQFITSVVCFPTTINPIIQNGFEPLFVDVTLPSLNLDLDQVEAKLVADKDKKIRGIIFAHVLGNPPDMDRLMSLVNKYDLIFLEDTCDALGSTWDNKPLGSFGHLSSCSFFPAHHMTIGEGGYVGVNNLKERIVVSSLRDWGRACYCNTKKPGDVTCGTACGTRFNTWFKQRKDIIYDHRYVFDEIGYNLKPTEMQAAMGLEQIKKLEYMHSRRKYNFQKLYNIFIKYPEYFILPEKLDKADVSWFGFLVTLKDNAPFSKAKIVSYLESKKIQTRSYFTGNALFHPAYSDLAEKYPDCDKLFPIATKSTMDTFFLGVYPGITDQQLDYIESTVDQFVLENK
jgi:CDP-6-deoxy-D-xylo-4-hexulose-3-dehydrase